MQAAVKLTVTIPADHRLELQLPNDVPAGPAEVIVLVPSPQELPERHPPSLAEFRSSLGVAPSASNTVVQSREDERS